MKRLFFLAIFITCNGHATGIQKWVDETGQIHYGDSPPATTQTEAIRISRPPSNPGKALPRLNDTKESETKATSEPQTAQNPAPETPPDVAKDICEKAQKDLKTLNRTSNVRLKMDDGTVRYMTEEEIEARKKLSEEDIEQFCK